MVLEHLISSKVVTKTLNTISNSQFGFIHAVATFALTNELFTSITQTDTVYLDIHKAFDSIPQDQTMALWNHWQALFIVSIAYTCLTAISLYPSIITPQICHP